MGQELSVIALLGLLAIPIGLMMATFWARARASGAARIEGATKDDPREP